MRKRTLFHRRQSSGAIAAIAVATTAIAAFGQKGADKPEYPPFDKVSEGYQKVDPTDGSSSLYTLWVDREENQLLAELPGNFESQDIAIGTAVASGSRWAGYQGTGAMRYVKWKRIGKRLALIQPNHAFRSSGDPESQSSVERTFTDRVLLDVPIVTMGPHGGPVIDLDAMLVGQGDTFFGSGIRGARSHLMTIPKLKAFPQNIEIGLEMPNASGTLTTYRYSISVLRGTPGYKPREADERVGYFTTNYIDLGKYRSRDKYVRYINRWHLEKRDPNLKMSYPKDPITFYVEHTVPVRYRPYVKEGIEMWNRAFEQAGIRDAIRVEFQDKETGKHMDKDPEDVRYNFILWLSNDISTAIGPSRAHPETGEILDADIVLTDGWLRAFDGWWTGLMPPVMMEGFTPETLEWLRDNPRWDPRVRLADPNKRTEVVREIQKQHAEGVPTIAEKFGAVPVGGEAHAHEHPGGNGFCTMNCNAATHKAYSMALVQMMVETPALLGMLKQDGEGEGEGDGEKKNGEEKEEEEKEQLLDGIPASFVGPLLADLVAHEVGHTLGLRHNFKASSIYTLDEINSEKIKGNEVWTASVMDYHPLNISVEEGQVQGDWAPIGIGPYDMWAIDYGYTFGKTDEVLKEVADPMHTYGTDEDTSGPDPLARRYDLSADPLDYAKSRTKLAGMIRGILMEKYAEEGESWSRVRRGYELSLFEQARSVSMMANWIGGAHIHRHRKGDPNAKPPIVPVDAKEQRQALRFVIDKAFSSEAFGLTPEMLQHMTVDKWWDTGGAFQEATWPVHDRIAGIQASVLTQLMNPTTLRRVYDNEYLVPDEQDALTLPELLYTVSDAVWSELEKPAGGAYTVRKPMIDSLRRNLQHEHLERLIDLTKPNAFLGAAQKSVSTLALQKLREIDDKIGELVGNGAVSSRLDPYTEAHLSEAKTRLGQVLNAEYIYNTDDFGGMGGGATSFFFREGERVEDRDGVR